MMYRKNCYPQNSQFIFDSFVFEQNYPWDYFAWGHVAFIACDLYAIKKGRP